MKKALLYNRYLHTAGGGERACFDIGLALEELGFSITVVTTTSYSGAIGELHRVFGLNPKSNWQLERIDEERDIFNFCKEFAFDIFVNSTMCSSMANPAPLGVYMMMFPPEISRDERERLLSYNLVLAISDFTALHLSIRWGADFPCRVLPPPISRAHTEYRPVFPKKERSILLVGRFNVDGHSKCQLEAVRAFKGLKRSGVLGDEWRLNLVGNLNLGVDNRLYLERCRLEGGDDVNIEINVPFPRLQELYASSSCLWQFTGVKYRNGEHPQYCEHLGLVALDSLCYGCVPIVYERSGVGYMLDHARSGFVFGDDSELADVMRLFNREFGSDLHKQLFDGAVRASKKFSFDEFLGALRGYVLGANSVAEKIAV